MMKKKIRANFQRIVELFTQKIVTKLSKIWVWDPGSGIWKKPIPDPGSRGQKGTGSRIWIRICNTVVYTYTVCKGGGVWDHRMREGIRQITHLPQSPFTGQLI
jgi:hypothetical protein